MTKQGDPAPEMAQLPLLIAPRDESTLEDFYPLPALQILLAAIRESGGSETTPERPGGELTTPKEPVHYLHGGRATGKSHLLQALCLQGDGSGVYLPLDTLSALQPEALLEGLEFGRIVALDVLEAVAGQAVWEEALFHLVNRCRSSGCQLWFAARAPAQDIGIVLPDLRSRLMGGLLWALPAHSDSEKLEILRFRARRRGLQLSDAVLGYLAKRGGRALGEQLELLDRLDRASLQLQRPLTVPLVREVMGW
ncbi:MAG: DnaA family protein [Halieaceae bacterium]|jgi:DnaA family protein